MIEPAFLGLLCTDFTGRVNQMSLHTADPGTTGANDSEVSHATVTWTVVGGISTATVVFTGLVGNYTHIGLWATTTFRMGIPVEIHRTVPGDVAVMVSHEVRQET